MPAYCATAIRGDTCTDDECPNHHEISRCEPCNCAFPTPLLEQHQSGKKHLRNVALNGHSNPGGPQQSPPLQPGPLNAQLLPPPTTPPPPATPPPSSGGMPTLIADSRVVVSSECGLDFVAEGTGTPENASLSFFADHTISITKTEVLSSLSVKSVVVEPFPNP
ncbi:hypothetical protein BJV78DRAFT_1193720 [Lactifluus subvellereus]|nr:hypothetical protein BJV78DRAFT_1193720 [Lactifluus subvellereus]